MTSEFFYPCSTIQNRTSPIVSKNEIKGAKGREFLRFAFEIRRFHFLRKFVGLIPKFLGLT
jgi:hypothetical protein